MKKILTIFILFLLFLVASCETSNSKTSNTDETTNELVVYIWASNTTTFFETDEIETIKSCYKNTYKDVHVVFHVIQNVDRVEFGRIVNEKLDADIILSGNNMDDVNGSNISLKTSAKTEKALIDSSWCNMDERYVGISNLCSNQHLVNAINFRSMLINEKPEFYKTQKVLFIGNSYTYYNNLSIMFKDICVNVGMNISVDEITSSGRNFEYMLNETTDEHKEICNKLSANNYNYVFIQEQSVRPITAYEAFRTTAEELVNLIHSYNSDTKVVLYETWAREEGNSFYEQNPTYTYKSMQKELCDAYTKVGSELNLQVSYVGVGFYIAHSTNNNIRLYQYDLSHPSPAGTYLAALIHASTIYGFSPNDVTYVPKFSITQGGTYKTQPTNDECVVLRNIADNVVFNLDLSILE